MGRMKFESPDMTAQNIGRIAEFFPNCVTEMPDGHGGIKRAINFDLLKQMLSPNVEDEDEAYEFTWVGKKAAIVEANKPIRKTLRPCPKESKNWNTTENLYIEGDNLEVLKLLQESYLGKIKMIYIDPPYNTGNDFIYNDEFVMRHAEFLEGTGATDDNGNRMFKNTDSNGRFHSDWCGMIYSRLLLARNLLTDDGVILISINEYETSNLSKLCEEVFGRKNFVCRFGWETKKAAQGMTTANMVVDNQESIYVYAKQIGMFKFRGLDRDEENGFSNPDKDPRGLWKRQYLQRLGQGLPVRTVVDPDTGNTFSFETPYTQDKLNRWIEEKRIIFPSDPTKYPARKEFLNEYENRQQLVTSLGLFATKSTTEKLYSIFDGIKIFSNPKPDTLMHFIIQQCAASPDCTILDFFSGSATTAHAVMQLNAEDGGRRKFIMVQLPEKCDESSEAYKAGYKNICEIGKERIRRAGDQILEKVWEQGIGRSSLSKKSGDRLSSKTRCPESDGGSAGNQQNALVAHQKANPSSLRTNPLDVGFRVLKLDNTNMKDVYYAPEEYDQGMLAGLESNIKEDRVAVTADLFKGKCIVDAGGNEQIVDGDTAQAIFEDLISNGYVKRGVLTDKYYADKANGTIQIAKEVADSRDSVINILDSVYDSRVMQPENARDKNVELQVDPDKLAMPEFQALWKRISPKSVYAVDFDTDELVRKAVASINRNLNVPKIFFKVETGSMDGIKSKDSLLDGSAFSKSKSSTYDSRKQIRVNSSVKYDLVGKLVGETGLTRKAVVAILTGIEKPVFDQFKFNPEEFIIKVAALINDEKATAIIQHITYHMLDDHYDTDIFTEPTIKGRLGTNAMKAQSHLYDHIVYDSTNERDFATALDKDTKVAVYVKLPNSFYIATPVGHYNPDWAIAFKEGAVKHVYFVAETKGSMSSMQLRLIEESKIHCAREHFKAISSGNVVYDVVDSYRTLLDKVMR